MLIGSYLSFALALFSKEAALLLPVMLLVYDQLFSERASLAGVIRQQKKVYFGYLLIAAAYLYVYFFAIPSQFYPKFLFFGLNQIAHVLIALKIFAHYLRALFFPWTVTILPPLYDPRRSCPLTIFLCSRQCLLPRAACFLLLKDIA